MSLLEVAKAARVSPSTVSRAINRPESLTTENLVAVREAITAMNYVPPPPEKRRGPKVGTTGSRRSQALRIGLWCVGATENHALNYYSSQLELLHFAVAESKMELRLVFAPSDAVPAEVLDGSIDGIILQGRQPTDKVLQQLAEFPIVWLMTRRSESWSGDYVEPDNRANGRLAADWLASQGARRWVFLASEPGYSAFAQRKEAFLLRARELGASVEVVGGELADAGSYLASPPEESEAELLAERFLDLRPAADGIYFPSDGLCGSFFRALRQQGGDPSAFRTILGHYNPQICDSLDPQPTAIDINLRAIIRHAVAQLADRVRNPRSALPVGLRIAPFLRN